MTCGKGLRMRTREYVLPQKAAMFQCNRQLVSKEMCVAAVPECEKYVTLTSLKSLVIINILVVKPWRIQKSKSKL